MAKWEKQFDNEKAEKYLDEIKGCKPEFQK
jgi:hypothetical protein